MTSIGKSGDHATVPGLVSDCRLMLRYALKDAFELPVELLDQIAQMDSLLKQSGFAPISDIDERLVFGDKPQAVGALAERLFPERAAGSSSPPDSAGAVERILRVHAGLSKVIAPASALTLLASEPPPGRHRFFGGMPLIVKAAALASFLSAVLFVASADLIADRVATSNAPDAVEKAALPVPQKPFRDAVSRPPQPIEIAPPNSAQSGIEGSGRK